MPAETFTQRVEKAYNTVHTLTCSELNEEVSVLSDISIPSEHDSKCFFPSTRIQADYGARHTNKSIVSLLAALYFPRCLCYRDSFQGLETDQINERDIFHW